MICREVPGVLGAGNVLLLGAILQFQGVADDLIAGFYSGCNFLHVIGQHFAGDDWNTLEFISVRPERKPNHDRAGAGSPKRARRRGILSFARGKWR